MNRVLACTALAVSFACTGLAAAQSTFDAPQGRDVDYRVQSGVVANDAGRSDVKFSTVVHQPNALWTRLYFEDVQLEPGSTVRMTSLLDGEVQELDAQGMRMWSNASAYFNGDSVLVELVAGPKSQRNSFSLSHIAIEDGHGMPIGSCGICGGDDREPSDEDWAGRLMPGGCSASIYNEQSCAVSAGHCMGGNNAIHFRVPNSSNCNMQNPPVADQFPITDEIFIDAGVGSDWAAMTIGTNNLGQTPYERYGEYRPIADSVAPNGAPVSVWGYGASNNCTLAYTQQLSEGTISAVNGSHYRALIDVTYGNSGSALMRNGEIIGVVTHCAECGTGNIMNRIDASEFVAAREQLCSDPPPNNECSGAIAVGDGSTPFSTIGATTTGPNEPGDCNFDGDTQVSADVWFEYTPSCTGEVTISLCDGDQPSADPCDGFCGDESPEGCWCDEKCAGFGDCCPGVCDDCPDLSHCDGGPPAGPCDGFCGDQAPDGCWCDEKCAGFGDCCSGVCDDCPDLSHCLGGNQATAQASKSAGAGDQPIAPYDTKLAVYNGCPTGSGQVLNCNNDECGLLSEVTVSAQAGQPLLIRIGGHNGATGEGILSISCESTGPQCDGDLNSDGVINVSDMLQLLGDWGACAGCDSDLNGDSEVNVSDLLILLGAWGNC